LYQLLTGIEIRVFLVIDALSRFSGMAFACSADLPLLLAKQLLDSTAIGAACSDGRTGADVTVGSWRGFRNPPLTPRIPRFLIPANTSSCPAPRWSGSAACRPAQWLDCQDVPVSVVATHEVASRQRLRAPHQGNGSGDHCRDFGPRGGGRRYACGGPAPASHLLGPVRRSAVLVHGRTAPTSEVPRGVRMDSARARPLRPYRCPIT
jgi:hypothetical protein